jgi:transposase-like protein
MNTVKIENSTFVRDIHSKAILNTDKRGLDEYLMQKEIAKRKNTESEDAKNRLTVIEQDMQEIKRLLAELNSMRTVNGN